MQFRKKPVVIDATQHHTGDKTPGVTVQDDGLEYVDTLEGLMRVRDGDFIITGVAGEVYPCREDIFRATYERVL
jgi:hypothetical protein